MKFRTRLVVTLAAVTALTNLVAFGTASLVVTHSEERQLDWALRTEAREEAAEISEEGQGSSLRISDRGGPKADDVGRLTKYAAIYDERGNVLDHTETFASDAVPRREDLPIDLDLPFDWRHGSEDLRAVIMRIPRSSESVLLLAASREDLEKDTSFLWKVMVITAALSIGGIVTSSWWIVRRLTRGHTKITETAHRIAAGDLKARVGLGSGDDEVIQLARDIDEMVERLNLVIEGQSRFIAYAAHELRTPLTVLYGELQLALRRSRSAEDYREMIAESLEAVRRLNRLVEDLLYLARLSVKSDGGDEASSSRLGEIVDNAVYWIEASAKEREIELDIDVDAELVVGSAMAVERSLRNLLENAVRHSPRGGRVALSARLDGEHLEIRVRDHGPGIAPPDRARIFEPFFRAASERMHPGSGLGLAIVREIARAHGGDAFVAEAPDGPGAMFCVRLKPPPPAPAPASPPRPADKSRAAAARSPASS